MFNSFYIKSVIKRMKYVLIFIGAYIVLFILSRGDAANWYDIVTAYPPFTLILTSFLHFGLDHLISNMQSMLIFGWVLCSNISYKKANGATLPLLLTISSIVTSILPYYLQPEAYTAGASGAAYALEAYVFTIAFLGKDDPLSIRLRKYSTWLTISAILAFLWFFNTEVSFIGHFSGAVVGVIIGLFDIKNRQRIKRINDMRRLGLKN